MYDVLQFTTIHLFVKHFKVLNDVCLFTFILMTIVGFLHQSSTENLVSTLIKNDSNQHDTIKNICDLS